MRSHLLLPLLLVGTALALSACGGDTTDDTDAGTPDAGCAVPCGTTCCPTGQSCGPGNVCKAATCTPSCSNKICGDDGCGGSCGDCPVGRVCSDGLCVQCQPSCQGKVCGPDGCGGTCGSCGQGTSCQNGQCAQCTPNCQGKSCGDDGCGGSCGSCGPAGTCDSGACVECKQDSDCAARPNKKCDTQKKVCVGCRNDFDCNPDGSVKCSPNTNTCIVSCTSDAQCAAVAGLPKCNTNAGLCVACLSDSHCSGATPNCDTLNNTCVVCVNDGDCFGSTPACKEKRACVGCTQNIHCGGDQLCDTAANRCVECRQDSDCRGGFCSTAQKCVQCRTGADCTGADKACVQGVCKQCGTDNDCAASADRKKCQTASNVCVACLGDADCAVYPGNLKRCLANVCAQCTTGADCLSGNCRSDNTCEPPRADNDTCATAKPLDFANGDVATAQVDTTLANDDITTSCGADGNEVVYSMTLLAGQSAQVEVTGSGSMRPVVYARANNCSSTVEIACATGTNNRTLVSIPAPSSTSTIFLLIGDGNVRGTLDIKVTRSPSNNTCASPQQLNLGSGSVTINGSTTLATD
ncbi:MAG: hypothetical protein ACK4N5_07295, partial [Myxococcales bacterium]